MHLKPKLRSPKLNMTSAITEMADVPVRKSTVVNASAARAFQIFTEGLDTWWPRTHHIGKSPMKRAVLEGRVGGRCYSEQEDGTQCDWASILVWEPPQRFVMAWQITPDWQYKPDLSRSSEVEVRFTPTADGQTRVDLEHRYFARHGAGDEMRTQVGQPGGWTAILESFAAGSAASSRPSAEESAKAEQYLIATRDELLHAVSDLSNTQWRFKPAPDCWSIGENVEHIVIVENRVHGIVDGLRDSQATEPGLIEKQIDEAVLAQIRQRAIKWQAPERIRPTGQWNRAEALEQFAVSRSRTFHLLAQAPALRGQVVPHPVLGPMDGYQWILAAAAHSARHTDQIAEVKAGDGFPAS
jgi:uncharacterized protein YndB with AHSA1/START domain